MDLSDPTRAITSTLDGAVLAVLATAGKPLTAGQVAQQAARGSQIGIRRSLARLVEQGTVRATLMGRNQVHELNRDHVAAPIPDLLAGLRIVLWTRFRQELASWRLRPLYACVFGSAARGDGNETSDIDLLLVRPPFPNEEDLAPSNRNLVSRTSDTVDSAVLLSNEPEFIPQWEGQLDRLRLLAERWTGNPLQIVDLTYDEWRRPAKHHQPLLDEVRRDGIELVEAPRLRPRPARETTDGTG